jgi:hypothetical protein
MRDPAWGVKLTGKEGANTIGAYVVQDEVTNLIFPSSQYSSSTSLGSRNYSTVLRYKRDFGSRYTAGILGTSREGDHYFNRVLGFDLDFRFTPTERIQLLALGSSTQYPQDISTNFGQPSDDFNSYLVSFEYDHYTRSWGWWADYEEVGVNFRADLGYFPRVGYRNVEGGLLHMWNAPPGAWWAWFRVGVDLSYFEELNGKLLDQFARFWFTYRGILQSDVVIRVWREREGYADQEFDKTAAMMQAYFWPVSDLQLGVYTIFGDQIDYENVRLGKRLQIYPWLSYNLGKYIRFSLNHAYEQMHVNEIPLYTANISQLTTICQFTTRMFFRSILQYVVYDYNPDNYTFDIDPEFSRLFVQLLFSYKINPRTVLFLGYSDNYQGDQDIRLKQSNRTLFLKIGYAWVI